MFVLTILEKNNGASLKFSQGSVTVLQKKWQIIIKWQLNYETHD